jgi:hypothetical protein
MPKAARAARAEPAKRNRETLDRLKPSVLAALPEKELLEAVQRRTFRYFWEGAHPTSGLARDRLETGGAASDDLVAIGGSGFGVMTLLVAVERGWVERDAAAERLNRMLEAMGRYAHDRYYSGGAYYFSTLGAAEFYFRAGVGTADPARLFDRGDAFLNTVRAFTPRSGDLSEQFDQTTGEQRSAPHLAWSYAAFISCIAARKAAAQHL